MREQRKEDVAQQEGRQREGAPESGTTTSPRKPRTVAVWVSCIIAVCLFAWLVWPSPYSYDHLVGSGASIPVRTNRLTGDSERLTMGGWERMGAPADSGKEVTLSKEQLAKLKLSRWNFGTVGIDLNLSLYNGSDFDIREVIVNLDVQGFSGGKLVQLANRDYRLSNTYSIEPMRAGYFEAPTGLQITDAEITSCTLRSAKGIPHSEAR